MNKIVFTICLLFSFSALGAQNTMRVHYKDGMKQDIAISKVDSITFIEISGNEEMSLIGEWFWGSTEKGYYEVLTFNEDKTYTGYDNFFEYGYDSWTYGTYLYNGVMLNLWSNGYGYRRIYRWFVTGLTENALEVMTQAGVFVYYRIIPDPITIKFGDSIDCSDGDSFIFADDVFVRIEGNRLYGIAKGTTYIQKYEMASNLVFAYKVIIE